MRIYSSANKHSRCENSHNCVSVFCVTFCLLWFRITEERKDKVTLLLPSFCCHLSMYLRSVVSTGISRVHLRRAKKKRKEKWGSTQAAVNAAWHDWICHVPLETCATMASDGSGWYPTAVRTGPDWHRAAIKSDCWCGRARGFQELHRPLVVLHSCPH